MLGEFQLGSFLSVSKIDCVIQCHLTSGCESISFRKAKGKREGQCELNRIKYHVLINDGDEGTTIADGWYWYKIVD